MREYLDSLPTGSYLLWRQLFFFRRLAKEKGKSVEFMPNKEPKPITVALPWIDQEYRLYPPGGIQVYVTPPPPPS